MSDAIVSPNGRFGDRRGVAAGLIALMGVALVGMAALSVDLGVLLAARTEAQRAADAAALSGAGSLIQVPDATLARDKAIEYGALNTVHGTATTVLTGDVTVDMATQRVRVKVIRSTQRGSSIVNFFAKILGINTSNVSAVATAHAGVANGVNCPLPFVVVDRWWDTSDGEGCAETTDQYDPGTDVYVSGPLEALPGSPTEPTGYGKPDRGEILRIYPGSPGENPLPGWAFLLNLTDPGGNIVRQWIKGCADPDVTFEYDQLINIENGMKTGPVDQGFTDPGDGLINQDPSAYWGTTGPHATAVGGCVFRPGEVDGAGEQVCVSSPRVKPAFLIRPTDIPPKSGNADVTLRNFVGLFVICVGELKVDESGCTPGSKINDPNGGVWVRFIDYRGVKVSPPNANTGSLVRILQLIE